MTHVSEHPGSGYSRQQLDIGEQMLLSIVEHSYKQFTCTESYVFTYATTHANVPVLHLMYLLKPRLLTI